ncbi:hypothetical protein [Serratia fonticola]|uniref:hypothetical protein n=1 Tax=Serratia fonticola TaxID=47917 RepID=UPI0016458078|nr:hypothetical protein [Serratia fonticola]MBC3219284.1 hypothetical protein [Serratia fonticola]HEJ9057551.1 hypothetical protein [Serratia fonticola]
MNIDINKLEEILTAILEELKARGIASVPLDADFYWNIPSEAIYDTYNEPSELDIGQLEDDYEMLLSAKNKGKLVGYNLKHASSLLRYIAEKHPA